MPSTSSVVGLTDWCWLMLALTKRHLAPVRDRRRDRRHRVMLWPWVIGLFPARRVKQRRDDQIQQEVDKQINAQKGG